MSGFRVPPEFRKPKPPRPATPKPAEPDPAPPPSQPSIVYLPQPQQPVVKVKGKRGSVMPRPWPASAAGVLYIMLYMIMGGVTIVGVVLLIGYLARLGVI